MQTNSTETQLGLIDLFGAVWSQKWVILGVFILGTMVAFIFAINIANTLQIKGEIDQLPQDSSVELQRLRNVDLVPYSERDMLIRYAGYIRDIDIVDQAAGESNLKPANLDGEEINVFINDLVQSLKIEPETRRLGEDSQLFYVLSFSDSNIDKATIESFITNLLYFSNEKLVSDLLDEISYRIKDKEDSVAWEIITLNEEIENLNRLHVSNVDDSKTRIMIKIDKLKEEHYLVLEDKITRVQNDLKSLRTRDGMELEDTIGDQGLIINRAKSEYALKKKDQIHFLREQLEIAEALGIKQPSDMGPIVPENAAVASVHNSEAPYYYRGSIAINKEIEEITGRVNNDSFVPELRTLQSDLAYLEKKRSDDRFVEGIRELEADLFLLQIQRDNDSYIGGLRDLQIESDMLDIQRENLAFVKGVNPLKQKITNLENDIELSIMKKRLNDVRAQQNGIKFVSYDERKSEVNNLSGAKKKLTLILGSGASGMAALLIGLLIWSVKRSYLRES